MTTETERHDLLDTLATHRFLFLRTVDGLTDDQARLTPIPSTTLTLGGLVRHLTRGETQWSDFVEHGAPTGGPDYAGHAESFVMTADQSLDSVLEAYHAAAARTDALVRTVDLDAAHPLPEAPWNPPDTAWTARRVFVHLVAEIAQHAGHADLLREAIDGRKSMG